MQLYTSYFGNPQLKKHAGEYYLVSIAKYLPQGYKIDKEMPMLAPSSSLLYKYKNNEIDETQYASIYLKYLDTSKRDILAIFNRLSCNKPIVFLCYEKPEAFCHRHLLADWLKQYGYDIQELENK